MLPTTKVAACRVFPIEAISKENEKRVATRAEVFLM